MKWYYFTDEYGWVGPFDSQWAATKSRDNYGAGDDPVLR